MKVPTGFEVEDASKDKYVLKLHRNMYDQKNTDRVWNKYLVEKLITKLGFVQSKNDECALTDVLKCMYYTQMTCS
jgi:hypothetical protein